MHVSSRSFVRISRLLPLAVVLASSAGTAAWAQSPGSLEPGQIERRFEKPLTPQVTQEKIEGAQPAPVKSEVRGGQTFTLNSVEVEGVTAYSPNEFDSLFADMVGKKVSVSQVQQAAGNITARYRQDGYILAQAVIPNQSFKGGRIKIRVFEGFISKVVIEGEHVERESHHLVESYGEKIKADRPLRVTTLERYLLLIDDLPGVVAKGVVRPSPDTVGAAELVVIMDHQKWEASANVNNRGTKFIGRNQFQVTGAANSLLGLYDRTIIRGITASPMKELKFFDIQHEEQLGSEGTKAIFTAGFTRTEPGETLKILDIEGRSDAYQIEINSPVIRSRRENFTPNIKFNWRDSDTEILNTEISEDKLRVFRVGAEYDRADSFNGINLVSGAISRGVGIWGASEDTDATSRADGEADFTKMNLTVTRLQSLPNNFSILASATGQFAYDPLLAPEEFSVGGESFGSAYDPSEITGDHGAALKLELRYGNSTQWKWLNTYQLYTFYDVGSVWEKDAPAGIDDKQSLASAGFGTRMNFVPWLSGTAEVAFPLTRDVANEGDDDTRLFFSLTGRF